MAGEKFVGTWELTAYEERLDDGTVIYPLGKDATGRLMYDDDGHFAAQLMKLDRPSFASGGVYGGTTEETEAAYNEFYQSEELKSLFAELIADKLAVSQILLLLDKGPLSTGEISEKLGLSSSEVAKHINTSTSQGLVRYDQERAAYALP